MIPSSLPSGRASGKPRPIHYVKKGWVVDEVIRTVVQFDLEDAHTAKEVAEHLLLLVKGKVYSAVVRTNGDELGLDDDTDNLDA